MCSVVTTKFQCNVKGPGQTRSRGGTVCYCVWNGGDSGLHSSDVWKQLGMEHRPCTQEGGKEREGGSVELGKSEGGGGGGRGGSSQWKKL